MLNAKYQGLLLRQIDICHNFKKMNKTRILNWMRVFSSGNLPEILTIINKCATRSVGLI